VNWEERGFKVTSSADQFEFSLTRSTSLTIKSRYLQSGMQLFSIDVCQILVLRISKRPITDRDAVQRAYEMTPFLLFVIDFMWPSERVDLAEDPLHMLSTSTIPLLLV
jgi:hypothetical protein